ncbi:SAM-dependent methyltransferase [Lysobacter soli]|uniref:SAM-dependent methyltransferase n=1 Tax=Lysobacter soli TaxID=453783 RepID=UPI0012EE5106|nr:SAM-dependent methyltransferase [Lysobacter soli]QGW63690.1 SAM-dependent methyltransferase [Lysobacter soli]
MSVADPDAVEHASSARETSSATHAATLPVAIALVSAAALAWQLLLMRWLAIAHWHPFAVMIISLALLGHGASGTWLSLWLRGERQARLARDFDAAFATCALLFAISAAATLLIARDIPFNGVELVWNPRQVLWLALLYLTLSIPFFFAAACFGLAFAGHGSRIPALYGADLIGAAMGALAALAASALPVQRGLLLAAICGPIAAWLVTRRAPFRVACIIFAVALAMLWPTQAFAPRANEFKGLSKTLLLPGARVIARGADPYGSFTLVESTRVPLRFAPGLSLSHTDELPQQLAIYTDGDAMSPIVRDDGHANWQWLDDMTSALPYRLRLPDRVLVLGTGGGLDVLQALTLGARRVDAVEQSALRARWARDDFGAYSGHLLDDRRVNSFIADPRAFVRATAHRYELIVLAGGESFASGGAGVQSASEQYALTVEALRDYLRTLSPRGMLVVTQWSKQPPRDELKLFATAVEALRAEGVRDPVRNVAAIRNWDASTWLFARSAFDAHAVAALTRFAERRGFDVVHAPGARADAQERFHQLDPPTVYDGVQALLSPQSREYIRAYQFDIEPVCDDRPYFGHFFRWRSLPELWRLRAQGGAVLLDSGYLVLVATLVQAVVLALVLVLLPLRALGRGDRGSSHSRLRIGAYFVSLGLAFLLIEIAMLSRLTLLLGHPWIAANVGLAAMLLCAGLGSLHAQRWVSASDVDDAALDRRIAWAVRAIVLGLAWQFVVLVAAHAMTASWPLAWRAFVGFIGIAPLAFAMGMPFPLGLARLSRSAPAFVPWAWGLNGCASVVAAILALLLAIEVGLRATLVIALALYVFAAWVWRPATGERG